MKTPSTKGASYPLISRIENPESYLRFQKEFYKAFETLDGQVLLRQIWKWDDEQKTISLRIPAEMEWVFVWEREGEPQAYAGASYGGDLGFSQVRHYGFSPPGQSGSYVEVMTLFRCVSSQKDSLQRDFLEAYCYPFLREKGYAYVLSTCSDRLLPMYLRWGWENPERREIEGFNRHLILKKL